MLLVYVGVGIKKSYEESMKIVKNLNNLCEELPNFEEKKDISEFIIEQEDVK